MSYSKNKKIILLFVILLAIWILFLITSAPRRNAQIKQVEIAGKIIDVEVVSSPTDTYKGLSGRANLCATCGMLFDFPEKEVHAFVMRNMNFPLDIIFIADNRITNIAENLEREGSSPKNSYLSSEPINKVLEVNANFCQEFQIKPGDLIKFIE